MIWSVPISDWYQYPLIFKAEMLISYQKWKHRIGTVLVQCLIRKIHFNVNLVGLPTGKYLLGASLIGVPGLQARRRPCLWRTPPSGRAHSNSCWGPAAPQTASPSARRCFPPWTRTCRTLLAAAAPGGLWDSPSPLPCGTYCSWWVDEQRPAGSKLHVTSPSKHTPGMTTNFIIDFIICSPQGCKASWSSPPPLEASGRSSPPPVSQWGSLAWS